MTHIKVTVDGVSYDDDVEPRLLARPLPARPCSARPAPRSAATRPTAARAPCCWTASSVKSCSVLAVQADGCDVTTIEGLAPTANGTRCSRPSTSEHALQCGYCTPGMIMAAVDLLRDNPDPSDEEIRDGLEGNLCRCTGYQNIVRAVRARPRRRRARPVTATAESPAAEVGKATDRARRTPGWSPARPPGPTTSCCPGMLHMAILRSPTAHARITSVDVSGGARAARRRRRVHRRRLRRRAGQPAVRLAGHAPTS